MLGGPGLTFSGQVRQGVGIRMGEPLLERHPTTQVPDESDDCVTGGLPRRSRGRSSERRRGSLTFKQGIIARLVECREDDPRVARCLMSVQAQIHARLVRNPIADRLVPDPPATADGVAAIARHITRFSLAGIRATAAP